MNNKLYYPIKMMIGLTRGKTAPVISGLAVAGMLFCQPLAASGKDPSAVQGIVAGEIDVLKQAQQAEDRWIKEKEKMQADYQALLADIERLEKQEVLLKTDLSGRQQRLVGIERESIESEKVKAELEGVLEMIMERLEDFVQRDLPFLEEERRSRIEGIKALLVQADTDLSEKCRRTMEALQVETQYGRTFEVEEETIVLDDQPLTVDVLRVGRLALFFRTTDGSTVGWYDKAAEAWQRLPSDYGRAVGRACEMAMKQRPVDLVRLPLGRIEAP